MRTAAPGGRRASRVSSASGLKERLRGLDHLRRREASLLGADLVGSRGAIPIDTDGEPSIDSRAVTTFGSTCSWQASGCTRNCSMQGTAPPQASERRPSRAARAQADHLRRPARRFGQPGGAMVQRRRWSHHHANGFVDAVGDVERLPAPRLGALADVFGERELRGPVERDVVRGVPAGAWRATQPPSRRLPSPRHRRRGST
jgi:hypothetical protein